MDAKFSLTFGLNCGLGFIKGYTKAAIESAQLHPDLYTREVLIRCMQRILEKTQETLDAHDANLSQVSK